MLRTHAWYVGLIIVSLGYEMACHIQSTTEAAPVRWKQSLMGVLICKTIALFHCVSFDCFIELQVFHQVACTSITYSKKNGYPSMKKRQRKSRNHTAHVQPSLLVSIYCKDGTYGFIFNFFLTVFKAPHLVEVVYCRYLCPEDKQ